MMAADTYQRAAAAQTWRWSQQWRDVLFLHWPAELAELRPRLPVGLEVDSFGGRAWVSFVGFRLQGVRLHGWPAIPFCSQMLELNFRTYVRYRDKPAICFLSMHADHRWMVAAARMLTPLPYEMARLTYRTDDSGGDLVCQSPAGTPLLAASFRLGDRICRAEPGSLDAWLTERYVAYVGASQKRLLRMQVLHEPWQLREVELQCCRHQTPLQGEPLCHYSAGVSSLLGRFETV